MDIKRLAVWTALSAALLTVFAAYLAPEMALTLAMQVWNCF